MYAIVFMFAQVFKCYAFASSLILHRIRAGSDEVMGLPSIGAVARYCDSAHSDQCKAILCGSALVCLYIICSVGVYIFSYSIGVVSHEVGRELNATKL